MSDHISAGGAVCWMATVKGLMAPDNNQTRGQSCYAMLHPGLFSYLDYPDVANLACPKPMVGCCHEALTALAAISRCNGPGSV